MQIAQWHSPAKCLKGVHAEGKGAVEKALEIDDTLADAHANLGHIIFGTTGIGKRRKSNTNAL